MAGKKNVTKRKLEDLVIESLLSEGKSLEYRTAYQVEIVGGGLSPATKYLVIVNDGFEIHEASKKVDGGTEVLKTIKLLHTKKWSEFTRVEIDKFAATTQYKFDDGFTIKLYSDKDFRGEVEKSGLDVVTLERKWYNKILGFRSKKRWKMVIASAGYFFIFLIFVAALTGGGETEEVAGVEEVSADVEPDEETEESPPEEESNEIEQVTFDGNLNIDTENGVVSFSGTTDLIDGSKLRIYITGDGPDDLVEEEVYIQNGEFIGSIDISSFSDGLVLAEMTFDPSRQDEAVKERYGENGEYISGDQVEEIGTTNMIHFATNATKISPTNLNGTGNTATDTFNLAEGFAVVTASHNGSANFILEILNEYGGSELLVNEIGSYSGKTIVYIPNPDVYHFNVSADGSWEIEVSQSIPEPISTDETISGSGDDVVFVYIEAGQRRFSFTHNGESNFIVLANAQNVLANEIGSYEGSISQTVSDSTIYPISVQADGSWTITIE